MFDTYYPCAYSAPEHEVAVFLGKGFERDTTDWSTLRRVDDKKGRRGGGGGVGASSALRSAPAARPSSLAVTTHRRPTQTATAVATTRATGASASAESGLRASDVLHVLIVEDSLPIMKAMTMNLRRAKHTVEQAVNGLIGLECMKQKEFDVVVMDLQVHALC